MKAKRIGLISGVILSIAFPVFAQQYNTNQMLENQASATNPRSDGIEELVEYLANLGLYLGYKLDSAPSTKPDSELINAPNAQVLQNWALYTLFGAIPVNAIKDAFSSFVPPNATTRGYNQFNPLANITFQPSGDNGQGGFDFKKTDIDQETVQKDPVSQLVLNMIATPSATFCMNSNQTKFISDCKLKDENKVIASVIGNLPKPTQFFKFDFIEKFLPQLNSNTLIAPLWYSNASAESTTESTSSESLVKKKQAGLSAENQAQVASNFIRYASGGVLPIDLPSKSTYNDLYNKATGAKKATKAEKIQAQASLNKYLAGLRVYASQISVGISNLYYIFAKRIPQNVGGNDDNLTSQALSEFAMATWRLYNPSNNEPNQQWINKINNSSPATVQKEMAVLLAEINYQMYLSRQQQERILLTNSIQLFQISRAAQPQPLTQAGAS